MEIKDRKFKILLLLMSYIFGVLNNISAFTQLCMSDCHITV